MTTRDAGLTQEQVEAAEVHAAGSSHCGEIKSKSAFSRHSTVEHYPERTRSSYAACIVASVRNVRQRARGGSGLGSMCGQAGPAVQVQEPDGAGRSGGTKRMAPAQARSAVAAGERSRPLFYARQQ
jgi:hypothetical protein